MRASTVAPRLDVWLVACATISACFSDPGLPATGTGPEATTSLETTGSTTPTALTQASTGATTDVATTAIPIVCGDGQLDDGEACDDANLVDTDECPSTCQLAVCGDGFVWTGVEECDDGPANHPNAPDAGCRDTCQRPVCGDGALYIGPLGPELVFPVEAGTPVHSDDNARAIGVDAAGNFSLVYSVPGGLLSRIYVFKLDPGGALLDAPINLANSQSAIRDPVIAVAPGGDLALAWESNNNGGDIFALGVVAGVADDSFNAIDIKAGAQGSPSIALDDAGRLVLAFIGGDDVASHVHLRRIDNFSQDSPTEVAISEHLLGAATSPTVALHPSGAFAIAWGDPGGAILYRRFAPDGLPGPIITTSLKTGGLATAADSHPWSGAAFRADASVVIAGLGPDGLLNLERFDPLDAPQERLAVSTAPRLHTPHIDLASDPWGNLAVAWAECGLPGDAGPDCGLLPHDLQLAHVRADMTAHAAPTLVYSGAGGPPPPIGLVVAPTGATAVNYLRGADIIVRIAAITCP